MRDYLIELYVEHSEKRDELEALVTTCQAKIRREMDVLAWLGCQLGPEEIKEVERLLKELQEGN